MADIIGPSLDQLNLYGNLDQMRQVALDDSFWTTLAIREGEATPSVAASVSASCLRIQFFESSISALASVTSEGICVKLGSSSLSVTVLVTAEGIRVHVGESSITTEATATASGGVLLSGRASADVLATMASLANGEFIGSSVLSGITRRRAALGDALTDGGARTIPFLL